MRVAVLLCLVGVCYGSGVVKRQIPYGGGRQVVQRFQGGPPIPQGFRAAPVDEDSHEEIDRNTVQPTHSPYVQRPQPVQYRAQENPRGRPQEYNSQGKQRLSNKNNLKEEELEEEEKEEPDRLTMLLPQSKFSCQGKNTGYYADDGLACEVFHYCQDNARHSWICPEGFVFHQVHLICMPPSSDNICTQSAQYHFVNDFLYKPINAEEVLHKPNTTLRYSDRYYPENYYEEDLGAPLQQAPQQQVTPRPRPQPIHQTQQPIYQTQRPQQVLRQSNQVFHSPEEVNIPLQHRRPIAIQSQPHRNFQQSSEEYEY